MFTEAQLRQLNKEKLLDIAELQIKRVNEIRGYESGMDRRRLNTFDEDTLIHCILVDQKRFKL